MFLKLTFKESNVLAAHPPAQLTDVIIPKLTWEQTDCLLLNAVKKKKCCKTNKIKYVFRNPKILSFGSVILIICVSASNGNQRQKQTSHCVQTINFIAIAASRKPDCPLFHKSHFKPLQIIRLMLSQFAWAHAGWREENRRRVCGVKRRWRKA